MKLEKCFDTTVEKVNNKNYNIFIPICLGNKYFSEGNIISNNVNKYLSWSLDNTKDKVLFLVVDKIQDTNYFIRNKNSSEKNNFEKVMRDGKKIVKGLYELIENSFKEKQGKIDIIQWQDYEKENPFCNKISNLVYKEFKNNVYFKEMVLSTVKSSVNDRMFSEEQYLRLCDYVLDEFSVIYSGVNYNGNHYGLFIYPNMDSVSYFIEGIKNGELFLNLKEKLPQKKAAFGVLN